MRTAFGCILLLAVTVFLGCKKDNLASAPQNQYTDLLTLGTGMSGFEITGETTSFARMGVSVIIYWRLESSTDMAGSSVKIRFDRLSGPIFAPYDSMSFLNPQSCGHIMLSGCAFAGSTGYYRATGILEANARAVASRDFIVH